MNKLKTLLGTHNSLSGYKCFWLLRPINKLYAKCQNLSIEEQFDSGVRYFDIRLRFTGRNPVSGHGIIKYHIDLHSVFKYLNSKATANDPIYVRLVYEDTFIPFKKTDWQILRLYKILQEDYSNIIFLQCVCKKGWRILSSNPKHQIAEYSLYASSATTGKKLFSPIRWAKKCNSSYWERVKQSSNMVNMFDFIDIK